MNLVFMSDTLAPNRNEDADLLPYNSYYSEVFFEYTRLNMIGLEINCGMMLILLKNCQRQKSMLLFGILLIVQPQWKR